MLHLFEIEHRKAKDFVIAASQADAILLAEEFHSVAIGVPIEFTNYSVNQLDPCLQTVTDSGLKSVGEIVALHDRAKFLKEG